MNVRLKKEFQALFWPWLGAAVIGLLPLLTALLKPHGLKLSISTAQAIATSTYIIGVALLAAMLFGIEFQQRTISLLLSQPHQRRQIWWNKIVVAGLSVLILSLIHIIGYLPNVEAIVSDLTPTIGIITALFSTAIFWSLITRSILGGIVFSIFNVAAIVLAARVIDPLLPPDYQLFETTPYLTFASCPIFLWLSWLRFQRLEITGNWDGEKSYSPQIESHKQSSSLIRSYADRPYVNLMLKELRLLRPVFLMMLLFTLLWLAAAVAAVSLPYAAGEFALIITGLSYIYIPIVILSAGCISIGEEKKLGIHANNLTSPAPIVAQWLVKNAVATLAGLSATMLLFTVLSLVADRELQLLPLQLPLEFITLNIVLFLVIVALIQISFWAATVADRTIHAFFLAAVATMGFFFTFVSASKAGGQFDQLAIAPAYWFIAHKQLCDAYLQDYAGLPFICVLIISFYSVIFPGLACFRRVHSEQRNLKTALIIPLLVISLSGAIVGAIQNCITPLAFKNSPLYQETEAALRSLNAHVPVGGENSRKITYAELAATGKLSPLTLKWLRNSTVNVTHSGAIDDPRIMALVIFPESTWVQPVSLSKKAENEMPQLRESIRKQHAIRAAQPSP